METQRQGNKIDQRSNLNAEEEKNKREAKVGQVGRIELNKWPSGISLKV